VTIAPSAVAPHGTARRSFIATEWAGVPRDRLASIYGTMNKPAFVFDGRMILDADKLRQIGFKVSLPLLCARLVLD